MRGVGPHPQEARAVGTSAHGVVARAERAADDHGQFGDAGRCHGMDHLRAVLGDAAHFRFTSHHEAGDVLQEHERDAALVAQLDEVSRFERGLAEQHSVVGDDADRISMNAREPADQSRAVARFELAEFAAIHQAGNDLMNIV